MTIGASPVVVAQYMQDFQAINSHGAIQSLDSVDVQISIVLMQMSLYWSIQPPSINIILLILILIHPRSLPLS